MQLLAIPGWGMLLALVGWVVPRHSSRGGPSLLFPDILAWACCWLWWAGSPPILAEGSLGALPRLSRLGPAVAFGSVVPRQSWRRAL